MGKLLINLLVIVSLALSGTALAATAESYYNNGVEFVKARQYDRAIVEFTKALEINPGIANAYALRSLCYGARGQSDRAIADSTKALEINPRLALAYENRAIGYFAKKRFDKAWDDVHKAQSLGYNINRKFLQNLRKASRRQN